MCVIWGVPYYFIRIAVSELTPATLVFFRTGGAVLILLPVAVARGGLRSLLPRWLPALGFALVEIGAPVAAARKRRGAAVELAHRPADRGRAACRRVASASDRRTGRRSAAGGIAGLLLGLAGVAAIVGLDLHATSVLALAEVGGVAVCYAVGPVDPLALPRRPAGGRR